MELDPRMSRSGGDGGLPTKPTSKDEIMAMDNLLDFKHDMKNIDKAQLKILEKKKQELKEWLVGLCYSMEDWKV